MNLLIPGGTVVARGHQVNTVSRGEPSQARGPRVPTGDLRQGDRLAEACVGRTGRDRLSLHRDAEPRARP
jgi:hypothetical protein